MYHRLFVHIVWTTRERAPLIDRDRAAFLFRMLPILARQARTRTLAMGIVSTHLHLLLRIHPTTDLSRMLQRMKGSLAWSINQHVIGGIEPLRWAKGYSITSVSPKALAQATAYVRNQAARHPEEAIPDWGPRARR